MHAPTVRSTRLALALVALAPLRTALAEDPPIFLFSWGTIGQPIGVRVDDFGDVYVADLTNAVIRKFDSDGGFVTVFGGPGTGDGRFNAPYNVAPSGDVLYVADSGNARIQKFDLDGNYLSQWGTAGSGDGQLSFPLDVVASGDGSVYVMDMNNTRVQKFDADGNFLTKWGSPGSDDGQFLIPHGIGVDPSGDVYVADFGNARIQKFDAEGNFLTKWGSFGTAPGEFQDPIRVTSDAEGRIYVADFHNYRVQKFDANGVFLSEWGSFGTGPGQFDHCSGVTVNAFGHIYAADLENFRIHKFVPTSAIDAPPLAAIVELGLTSAPNPFRHGSTIRFHLPDASPAALAIFDVRGALVRELVAGVLPAGSHRVTWDGRDARGTIVAAGVYVARLRAGDVAQSLKVSRAR